MFNPIAADAPQRLAKALAQQKLRAVALFPAMHRYRLDDEAVGAVFDAAAAHGAAVFVHCGMLSVGVRKKLGLPSLFDLRLGDPLAVAAVALRHPAVPVIIPHFGAGLFREALMAADQCPNVYLDTSSSNSWLKYHPGLTLEGVFRQALTVIGPDRLLFGTDSSFFPAAGSARSMTPSLPRSKRSASAQAIARRFWATISKGSSRMCKRTQITAMLSIAALTALAACARATTGRSTRKRLVLTNARVVTVETSPA